MPQTPEQRREYNRLYARSPKQQEYRKKYRLTPEYRAKLREYSRRHRLKRKEHEALASPDGMQER